MVSIITQWARDFPAELTALDAMMKRRRQAERLEFKRVHGMTDDKNMMHKGEIPARLYFAIGKILGNKDWIYDKRLREIFWRNFLVGCVNKKSISNWSDTG